MKRICAIIMSFVVLCGGFVNGITVKAQNNVDYEAVVTVYEECLKNLNEELGTCYGLLSEELLEARGSSLSQMYSFLAEMTVEEFEEYIRELHNNQSSIGISSTNFDDLLENTVINPRGYQDEQRCYYYISGMLYNVNYFSLKSTVYYADGALRYSTVDDFSSYYGEFPCYQIISSTHTFSEDRTQVMFNVTCAKFISEYVMQTVYVQKTIVFTAGDEDIYEQPVI